MMIKQQLTITMLLVVDFGVRFVYVSGNELLTGLFVLKWWGKVEGPFEQLRKQVLSSAPF